MILYHGTNIEIKKPRVDFSKSYLDFGRGFYLTTYKQQAEKWALRKALRKGGEAIINVFNLDEKELENYKVLRFASDNREWLEFVCQCRRGEEVYNSYDAIIGSVADDDVFKTVDMYFKGIWDIEQALKELRYYKLNDQICITKQQVLDHILVFKESYKVGDV